MQARRTGLARELIFDALASADEALVVDNKRPTGSGEIDGRAKAKANMVALVEQENGPEAAAKAKGRSKGTTR